MIATDDKEFLLGFEIGARQIQIHIERFRGADSARGGITGLIRGAPLETPFTIGEAEAYLSAWGF